MKVVPLEFLKDIGETERVVLAHGSYDCLHIGHHRYFAWAKKLLPDPMLIVTLTSDEFFPKYKGENRPAFPEAVRAEWIAYAELVDFVAIVNEPTGVLAINTIKPAIYAKGAEAQGVIPYEVAATELHGGVVRYMTKETVNGQEYSSGRILSGEMLRVNT